MRRHMSGKRTNGLTRLRRTPPPTTSYLVKRSAVRDTTRETTAEHVYVDVAGDRAVKAVDGTATRR